VSGRLLAILFISLIAPPAPASGQGESASGYTRYREWEVSRSYYEDYEVSPGRAGTAIQRETLPGRGIAYNMETGGRAWSRRSLNDAHAGILFYENRTCTSCHPITGRDSHTVRHQISCRQCHGGEPIASSEHYFSRLNPIRKHAYVCGKCHSQPGASFATYLIHEPSPANLETAETFPALFWVFWVMVGIFALTFLLFLPLAILWIIRELFSGKGHKESMP
jgi:hypothetical protein